MSAKARPTRKSCGKEQLVCDLPSVLALLKRAKKLSSARGTAESTCIDTALV